MKQISYYNGEGNSLNGIGIGMPPCNISASKSNIRKKLSSYQIEEGLYLRHGAVIKINNGESRDFSGELEIRIIAERLWRLGRVARELKLPFYRGRAVDCPSFT